MQYSNQHGQLWLNVASSTETLNDFVNLDNHIWMSILPVYPVVKALVPAGYRAHIEKFRATKARAPLVRHDCRKKLPFPDGSVDHILCSHFLEHVYVEEMKEILRDFHRALKPGGTVHIIVPDLRLQAEKFLSDSARGNTMAADEFVEATVLGRRSPGSWKYRMLELRGSFGLQHRWMYDRESIAEYIRGAGFECLSENTTPSREFRQGDGISVHVAARKV